MNKGLIGRFQTPDPYQPSAKPSSPQSWNRYAYVENDPANALDPTGLFLLARQADGNDGGGDGAGGGGGDGWFHGTLFYGVPWPIGPELPIIRGGGGGGGAVSFASAKAAFQRAAKDLSSKKFSKNCEKDLTALHVSDNQVHSDAAAAVFLNGVGNKTPVSSLYASSQVQSVRQAGAALTGTVGTLIAKPGTVAVAQLGGPDIYLNPGLINTVDYFTNSAIALHEILHNVTGLTDPDIQSALGLPQGKHLKQHHSKAP